MTDDKQPGSGSKGKRKVRARRTKVSISGTSQSAFAGYATTSGSAQDGATPGKKTSPKAGSVTTQEQDKSDNNQDQAQDD